MQFNDLRDDDDDLEAMGPTYVKLGQCFPAGRTCSRRLFEGAGSLAGQGQTFVILWVEQIVARELGVRISKAFSRFDRRLRRCPFAARDQSGRTSTAVNQFLDNV